MIGLAQVGIGRIAGTETDVFIIGGCKLQVYQTITATYRREGVIVIARYGICFSIVLIWLPAAGGACHIGGIVVIVGYIQTDQAITA